MEPASGITNLQQLIRSMQPLLHEGSYVFCSLPSTAQLPFTEQVVGMFREKEGLTVIVPEATAKAWGYSYAFVAAWITLQVHSSLAAVGLTAAVATALAKAGVSCNVVAGFYHDHLFVAKEDGEKAVQVLEELAATGS